MSVISHIQYFISELVIADRELPAQVVEKTIRAFPKARADLVVVALASVACELQELYSERDADSIAYGYRLYKVSAILACDIAAMRASGTPDPRCADLLVQWNAPQNSGAVPQAVNQ